MLTRRRAVSDLRCQVVLITGGSRGLGLALAHEFANRDCRLAICARDGDELARARKQLEERGARVQAIQCDVGDRDQVRHMVDEVIGYYGHIDVLVNNAGTISVAPIENLELTDFEQAMDVMFWGAVYPTLAVLPQMQRRAQGRIVNITSIGGKISVPHLVPYSCAKFATVAFSEGLRAELDPYGIKVVTIVPGLMRTGSHLNAKFKGNASREFAWFGIGAATPIFSISARRAARSIVRATERGSAEVILSLPAQVAARVHGLAPELTAPVLNLVNRWILPRAGDSPSVSGRQAQSELNSRIFDAVTALGQSAAKEFNEVGV